MSRDKFLEALDAYANSILNEPQWIGDINSRSAVIALYDECAKDARRYQWLRDKGYDNCDDMGKPYVVYAMQDSWGKHREVAVAASDLDSAIDSAMEGKE